MLLLTLGCQCSIRDRDDLIIEFWAAFHEAWRAREMIFVAGNFVQLLPHIIAPGYNLRVELADGSAS